jgi:hypothetical protein
MQTVNLSAASAAMRAGASAGSGATMIALLLLVNLALAGAVSLPPLPGGAGSAGAGLALDAVLLALLVAGVAFDLRRVWRADRRLGVQALGGAVGRVAEGLGCVAGLVLAAHLCPGSVGGVLGLGLAGLIVGCAVGVRRLLAGRGGLDHRAVDLRDDAGVLDGSAEHSIDGGRDHLDRRRAGHPDVFAHW